MRTKKKSHDWNVVVASPVAMFHLVVMYRCSHREDASFSDRLPADIRVLSFEAKGRPSLGRPIITTMAK